VFWSHAVPTPAACELEHGLRRTGERRLWTGRASALPYILNLRTILISYPISRLKTLNLVLSLSCCAEVCADNCSFDTPGACLFVTLTHGSRRGLHSFAASRLGM